jgi:hypothetical protein
VASKRILLVEGKNDRHVIYAIRDRRGIPNVFDVVERENDGQLLDSIPIELKRSEIERLAVILDADEGGIARRWEQLRSQLADVPGISIPKQPNENGTLILIPDGPLFGVWLMPDNRLPGMLEDFLAFLVPPDDELLPRVDGFLKGIPPSPKRFSEAHRPKSRIHCWLSLQKEPGKPLGQAITARYLDAACHLADPFVRWLRAALVD